jgi:hypothetical protein
MGLFDHLYHLDWTARYPLHYFFDDGRHIIFEKYEIDMFGNLYYRRSGYLLSYNKIGEYDVVTLRVSKKTYTIRKARAIVSTFHGQPPNIKYTTEHIDCMNKDNDIVCELTWMDPSGQTKNRNYPKDQKTGYIIVRDDHEMTVKEWVTFLKNEKNHMNRVYTEKMISDYARKLQYGFSYKVYEDLPDERWHVVINSESTRGHWEVSDKNRIARVSKFTRNVVDVDRMRLDKNYPVVKINGKQRRLHDIAFEAYYPEKYASKLPKEMILHKNDDKLDFRPHMLYIGDASKNTKDAYDNGCYDNTKSARMPCVSYINDVFEKQHDSLIDAEKYLRVNGHPKADDSAIREALNALKNKNVLIRYGRTWNYSNAKIR